MICSARGENTSLMWRHKAHAGVGVCSIFETFHFIHLRHLARVRFKIRNPKAEGRKKPEIRNPKDKAVESPQLQNSQDAFHDDA